MYECMSTNILLFYLCNAISIFVALSFTTRTLLISLCVIRTCILYIYTYTSLILSHQYTRRALHSKTLCCPSAFRATTTAWSKR